MRWSPRKDANSTRAAPDARSAAAATRRLRQHTLLEWAKVPVVVAEVREHRGRLREFCCQGREPTVVLQLVVALQGGHRFAKVGSVNGGGGGLETGRQGVEEPPVRPVHVVDEMPGLGRLVQWVPRPVRA